MEHYDFYKANGASQYSQYSPVSTIFQPCENQDWEDDNSAPHTHDSGVKGPKHRDIQDTIVFSLVLCGFCIFLHVTIDNIPYAIMGMTY